MKIADVRYTGTMRSNMRKGEEGTLYKLRNPMGGEPIPEPVYNLHDALNFERVDELQVDWTVQGEVARRVGRQASNAKDALTSLSYRQKQRLVKALGMEDVKGNAPEEELEEALQPVVDEMMTQMELR